MEAMEHERWSRSYKEFTTYQLERAQEDVQSAEDQLKSAEEYMCSILDAIRCLGFTVRFIDSQTAAVAKTHNSMSPNILYSKLLTLMCL
jgi:septation ring formation regulator EzrA